MLKFTLSWKLKMNVWWERDPGSVGESPNIYYSLTYYRWSDGCLVIIGGCFRENVWVQITKTESKRSSTKEGSPFKKEYFHQGQPGLYGQVQPLSGLKFDSKGRHEPMRNHVTGKGQSRPSHLLEVHYVFVYTTEAVTFSWFCRDICNRSLLYY